jgi:hypothetical protein
MQPDQPPPTPDVRLNWHLEERNCVLLRLQQRCLHRLLHARRKTMHLPQPAPDVRLIWYLADRNCMLLRLQQRCLRRLLQA